MIASRALAEANLVNEPKWACCLRRLERFGAHFLAFSTLPIILIFIERAGAVSAHLPALGDHREMQINEILRFWTEVACNLPRSSTIESCKVRPPRIYITRKLLDKEY